MNAATGPLSMVPEAGTSIPRNRRTRTPRLWRWWIRLTPTYRQLAALGYWFERTLCADLKSEGPGTIDLDVRVDGEACRIEVDGEPPPFPTDRVARLLSRVGIRRIHADVHLEGNQLIDVGVFLWRQRDAIARLPAEGPTPNSRAGQLCSPPGVHLSCTDTRLDCTTGELSVTYTYCETPFSRGVRWFKLRNRSFRDHRAFFRAAPRYALIAVVTFLLPGLLTIFEGPRGFIIAAAVVLSVLIYLAVFVLFHTLGSVEYDKETQESALQKTLAEMRRARAIIEADLRRARQIQQGLVPTDGSFPLADRCTIVADFDPQIQVGGDYYDFKVIAPGKLALVFGDVAGHGMGAAFVTGLLKTLFELEAEHFDRPAGMVEHINDLLVRVLPSDSFAALVYAILDFNSRRMTFCNAGHHPPPWLMRSTDPPGVDLVSLESANGMLCGVLGEQEYPEETVELSTGTTLVLATDGWLDTRSPGGERFGRTRFEEVLRRTGSRSVDDIHHALDDALSHFAEDAAAPDDRALVLLRVK